VRSVACQTKRRTGPLRNRGDKRPGRRRRRLRAAAMASSPRRRSDSDLAPARAPSKFRRRPPGRRPRRRQGAAWRCGTSGVDALTFRPPS
jgi:hypothetical protein